MNKTLSSALPALALIGLTTACSHDTIDYSTIVDSKLKAYQEVFTDAFGAIDRQQTWGFGTADSVAGARMTRAVSDYSTSKGSLTSTFQFPTDCPSSKFLSAVPGNVGRYPTIFNANVGTGGRYYIDYATKKVNMYFLPGTIYVKGTCDLSARPCFEVVQGTEIYLIEGSVLKLNEQDAYRLKAKVYIAPGARLETTQRLKFDNNSAVYNHGTIEARSFEVNGTSILYNTGTLKITRDIYVANLNSAIVNDGTIVSGSEASRTGKLDVHGSGHVQNNAEWTVYGNTFISSSDNSWVNNGKYITDYFTYTGGSRNVINNCLLTVNENFCINTNQGSTNAFQMDGNAGVVAKNFYGGGFTRQQTNGDGAGYNSGPYKITMGQKSVFKVLETATLSGGNAGYGFFGPTGVSADKYAVFEAKHIVQGTLLWKNVTYSGGIYVVAEDHFRTSQDQWNKNSYVTFTNGCSAANIYASSPDDEYSTGKPTLSISQTPCSPGFSGGSTTPEEIPIEDGVTTEDRVTVVTTTQQLEKTELVQQGRVFCEDLGRITSNDLDFNDAVFDAYVYRITPLTKTVVREDGKQVTDETVSGTPYYRTAIVLLAAGGTLQLTVAGFEVHEALGSNTATLINTAISDEEAAGNPWTTADPVLIGEDFQYTSIADIPVFVKYAHGGVLELQVTQGMAPHKILVPINTQWTLERMPINHAFTNFRNYVNRATADCWNHGVNALYLFAHNTGSYPSLTRHPGVAAVSSPETKTTYRSKGTSTTTGGYQGEEVLARKRR